MKELVLRAQTADAFAGIREQVHGQSQAALQGLGQRQEQAAFREQAAADEMSVLTEKNRSHEQLKALEYADAASRREVSDLNTFTDNAGKLEDEAAIDAYFESLRAMGKQIPPGMVESLKANVRAKAKGKADEATAKTREGNRTFLGTLKTAAAVEAFVKANPDLASDPRVAPILADARAYDKKEADVSRARNRPPAVRAPRPPGPPTDAGLASLIRLQAELNQEKRNLQETARSTGWRGPKVLPPESQARIDEIDGQLLGIKSRLSRTYSPNGGSEDDLLSAVAKFLQQPEPE